MGESSSSIGWLIAMKSTLALASMVLWMLCSAAFLAKREKSRTRIFSKGCFFNLACLIISLNCSRSAVRPLLASSMNMATISKLWYSQYLVSSSRCFPMEFSMSCLSLETLM